MGLTTTVVFSEFLQKSGSLNTTRRLLDTYN